MALIVASGTIFILDILKPEVVECAERREPEGGDLNIFRLGG